MAELFLKQAKQYKETRPSYPPELFQFIASKTPSHDLVWDVGTGSGQAAISLSRFYKNVIGTDTSDKQLELAPKLQNIRYQRTPPTISRADLERDVAALESSLDLVTIAQALHWLDLPNFYDQVKWALKKPHGVIAAWCYTIPHINPRLDPLFQKFFSVDSRPYWDSAIRLVVEKYMSIEFPFEPVDGCDHTGPFEFETERLMSLDELFTYIRSLSAYQTAREKGVELLRDEVIQDFKRAWDEDGSNKKVVKYPVYLRIGKVGNSAPPSV